MPQLFWHVIQQAKSEGRTEMDLGRSEEDNPGLIQFKKRLGAKSTTLSYWRRSLRVSNETGKHHQNHLRSKALSCLPNILFRLSGEIFYRHAG
jgi:lipid II:glycine glycyltransferase (peptidoglycan interpeptide bridge formation enzyme)